MLTSEQKKTLDARTLELKDTFYNMKNFNSFSDLIDIYSDKYSVAYPIASIVASFKRCDIYYCLNDETETYFFISSKEAFHNVNDFYKDKDKIYFIDKDTGEILTDIYYSFTEKKFVNNANYFLKMPWKKGFYDSDIPWTIAKPFRWLCSYFLKNQPIEQQEWIFNEQFKDWDFRGIIKENLPKGFYNYSIENNYNCFSNALIRTFKIFSSFKYPKLVKYIIESSGSVIDDVLDINNTNFIQYVNNQLDKITTINIREVKTNGIITRANEEYLYKIIKILLTEEKPHIKNFTIDTNRNLEYNYKLLNVLMNSLIGDMQKKISKINSLPITIKGTPCFIKVPNGIEELIEEGKQQNNCVGYYYNESIKKGENLIYFIRKIASPDKSFITCRYNVSHEATVETRYKNNVNCTFNHSDIDTIIASLLEEQ